MSCLFSTMPMDPPSGSGSPSQRGEGRRSRVVDAVAFLRSVHVRGVASAKKDDLAHVPGGRNPVKVPARPPRFSHRRSGERVLDVLTVGESTHALRVLWIGDHELARSLAIRLLNC